MYSLILRFTLTIAFCISLPLQADLYLRNSLKKAQKGDYIVTVISKAYTLFHIYDKKEDILTIEEITVPLNKIPRQNFSWKEWVRNRAPGQTNWMLYNIRLSTGQILDCYSVSKRGWYNIAQWDNFLPTLLNLHLTKIPLNERKKVGPPPSEGSPDQRKIWEPQMILNGKAIPHVKFEAWTTFWPKDGGELSGKRIEVYLPEESEKYPSYFPYWLQIKGAVGAATLRIVDSGSGLVSTAAMPSA